ncbi:MAG: hypothetical protein AAGB97_00805, partial [Dehalococcoidia bacterium]
MATEKAEKGEIVSIYVDYNHPLLQLKRALSWEAIREVYAVVESEQAHEGSGEFREARERGTDLKKRKMNRNEINVSSQYPG